MDLTVYARTIRPPNISIFLYTHTHTYTFSVCSSCIQFLTNQSDTESGDVGGLWFAPGVGSSRGREIQTLNNCLGGRIDFPPLLLQGRYGRGDQPGRLRPQRYSPLPPYLQSKGKSSPLPQKYILARLNVWGHRNSSSRISNSCHPLMSFSQVSSPSFFFRQRNTFFFSSFLTSKFLLYVIFF